LGSTAIVIVETEATKGNQGVWKKNGSVFERQAKRIETPEMSYTAGEKP